MADESKIVMLRPVRISDLRRDLDAKRDSLETSADEFRTGAKRLLHPLAWLSILGKHPQALFVGAISTLASAGAASKLLSFIFKRHRWLAALAASMAWRTTRVSGKAFLHLARPLIKTATQSVWRRLRQRFLSR